MFFVNPSIAHVIVAPSNKDDVNVELSGQEK
jgi:hypothetical protein